MRDESFYELYKKRGECESKHGHIKDVVKFDIRRIHASSVKRRIVINSM